uniref:Vascular endothelial growth factor c n=1 Tax=Stegastes partitus TaxID=144197 RepID=A0A3B5BE75_9TELE
MSLIYPSYWAALKCTSRLSAAVSSKASQRPQSRLLRPPADTEEPTFAAAYLNLDVLKSIESEWRKTQCMPKEVCVDVGREFGAPTNIFYKPPCVSVYRCGGCCHSEDKQCKNISTGYLSKTVSTSVFFFFLLMLKLSISNLSVAANMQLNPPPPPLPPPRPSQQHLDVCGPDKELNVESCQCVCRRGDENRDCGPNRHLNHNTCQCVCNVIPAPSCPLNHIFNKETCQCTCSRTCPRHQPLNKTKCSCECNESPNKCFLKGRRFHQATCSCLRPPCEVRRRRCEPGFFFSEEVCRCVPSHWRRLD